MTPTEMAIGMRHYFNLHNVQNYLCPISTLLSKQARIDIIKFDDWLHLKFGEYESKNKISMKQLIQKKFGKEAMQFITKLI